MADEFLILTNFVCTCVFLRSVAVCTTQSPPPAGFPVELGKVAAAGCACFGLAAPGSTVGC